MWKLNVYRPRSGKRDLMPHTVSTLILLNVLTLSPILTPVIFDKVMLTLSKSNKIIATKCLPSPEDIISESATERCRERRKDKAPIKCRFPAILKQRIPLVVIEVTALEKDQTGSGHVCWKTGPKKATKNPKCIT